MYYMDGANILALTTSTVTEGKMHVGAPSCIPTWRRLGLRLGNHSFAFALAVRNIANETRLNTIPPRIPMIVGRRIVATSIATVIVIKT